MTIEIKMARGFVTLLSDEDADLANYRWCLSGNGYANRRPGIYLHRIIEERILGRHPQKGEETDHINRNRLDNRRENIRIVNSSENKINRRIQNNNTTGYRGIWLQCDGKKWGATLKIHGKKKHLGVFDTPEEAARAYDLAAKQAQGEFYIGNGLA
jgi:hypothetical protein